VSGGISELTANCTAHTDLIYYIAVPLLVILPPLIGLLITVIESWSSGAQWTDRFDPDYWLKVKVNCISYQFSKHLLIEPAPCLF
jgi:hypothetical protein